MPLAIHPTFEPASTKGNRMGADNFRNLRLLSSVAGSDGVRHQFTTLFDYGVFDKFPRLKILVLECGAGWVGYWLDRIDAVFSHTVIGERVPLEQKPSDYFRERVWISCDPDERMIPALAQRYGVERFLWASDFPHADHTPEYIHDLNELVAVVPRGPAGGVHRRQRPRAVPARRPVHVGHRRGDKIASRSRAARCPRRRRRGQCGERAGPATSGDLAVLEGRATSCASIASPTACASTGRSPSATPSCAATVTGVALLPRRRLGAAAASCSGRAARSSPR